jgi:hypothetical protein
MVHYGSVGGRSDGDLLKILAEVSHIYEQLLPLLWCYSNTSHRQDRSSGPLCTVWTLRTMARA